MKSIRYDGPGGYYSELELWRQEQQDDNSEQIQRLRRSLRAARTAELTPRQAELLRLHIDEGLSMREIARRQGVSPSTVSRTLGRARERLRRCLRYGM